MNGCFIALLSRDVNFRVYLTFRIENSDSLLFFVIIKYKTTERRNGRQRIAPSRGLNREENQAQIVRTPAGHFPGEEFPPQRRQPAQQSAQQVAH